MQSPYAAGGVLNVFDEKSRSLWMERPPTSWPAIDSDLTADIAVIGSGIAGLSVAYEASLRGAKVAVLDRGMIGRGMTARTSAHLTSALDDFYHEFIAIRGETVAMQHFASQNAAIERIDEIRKVERIACDFARMPAYLFLAGDVTPEVLEEERKALAMVGLQGARLEASPRIRHKLSGGPCLVIPEQGRFHPLKYLDGLSLACAKKGVLLFANSIVTNIHEDEVGVSVKTEAGFVVKANAAVVATNSPLTAPLTFHSKQAPYRTFVFTAHVPKGVIKDVLYWDTEDPYHYVRLHPHNGQQLLLVGGEDYKPGTMDDADKRFRKLEEWARERFPEMGEVHHRWSGQVMDTIDFAAFIGLNPGSKSIYIATGDSGQGITHGVVAGIMLPQMIENGKHRWSDIYDPNRLPLRATGKMFSEGVDVLQNFAEYVSPGEIKRPTELKPGSGGILRKGSTLIAACRDGRGKLHQHSASCTHSGCVVHWNTFEQCWDCPCHGSHFAPDGGALNGPAIASLHTLEKNKS
jgi:glycine/D-amino acid oxidase-like deaminating enzyme/nitrite reductase/ring-hydroxylating ferredoxin subunit